MVITLQLNYVISDYYVHVGAFQHASGLIVDRRITWSVHIFLGQITCCVIGLH